MFLVRTISRVGLYVADQVEGLGRFGVFAGQMFRWLVTDATRWRLLRPQLYQVGVRSLPVVIITGAFVGMVLAAQSYYQFDAIGRASWVGAVEPINATTFARN